MSTISIIGAGNMAAAHFADNVIRISAPDAFTHRGAYST